MSAPVQNNVPLPQEGNQWVEKTYTITGDWKLEEKDGDLYFVLADNFKTSSGPDLKLYLLKTDMDTVGDRDSVDRIGVFVAELDSHKGGQSYKLPSGTKISDYKSLVIHCKKYSVVWGGVRL
ncbi:MAG: DM13 domain-containing protein [Bacteroidota bacterium]